MNYKDQIPKSAYAGDVRRRVIEAAGQAARDNTGERAALDLYLALLQDRLPVYVRTVANLEEQAGHGDVRANLIPMARATIDFYCEILPAKVSVLSRPDQLARLRGVLRSRGLGPHLAQQRIADYLCAEQRLGRIPAETAPQGIAQLFIGACLNYAFVRMLMGDEHVPPAVQSAEEIVNGLRLE